MVKPVTWSWSIIKQEKTPNEHQECCWRSVDDVSCHHTTDTCSFERSLRCWPSHVYFIVWVIFLHQSRNWWIHTFHSILSIEWLLTRSMNDLSCRNTNDHSTQFPWITTVPERTTVQEKRLPHHFRSETETQWCGAPVILLSNSDIGPIRNR